MDTVTKYRVLTYNKGGLVKVHDAISEGMARQIYDEWHKPDDRQVCVTIPPLPIAGEESEHDKAAKVLPTPMNLYSFDTAIGEILVASDDVTTARLYASSILRDYATITGKAVIIPVPDNVSAVHAVFLSGQSLTDFLDPSELAEFDYPGITVS